MELLPNPGKNLIIEIDGKKYARYPIKTHLITPKDNIVDVVEKYAKKYLEKNDIVFIGEKSVAISQGRVFEIDKVKPGKLAYFLVRFVTKSPYGIGLGSPQTMQLAIEEVGSLRIIIAALIAGIFKIFGIKGVFYKIAGPQVKAIDGAVDYAIPPYNRHVKKAPLNPNNVAQNISDKIGVKVAIVDACDLGVWIVGKSKGVDENLIIRALKDNPLGQTNEQTPIGILREVI
jgi:F420-0:gamma-glutamyl ligase-like protein